MAGASFEGCSSLPTSLTRRKLRVLWIFAGIILLFGVWFCYQLFGPNPEIVVSKETTFITEPLGPDGLPDYDAYLLQQGRKGVTPENNAAVLIWQAMWPGELEQQHWLLMCDALGMDKVPSAKDALVAPSDEAVHDQIALELAGRFSKQATDDEPKEDYFSEAWQRTLRDGAAYDLVGEAGNRPWTSEQLPALAKWVEQNQKPLDLLVEASKRPRYFSPSPSMLNGSKDMLIATLLPDIQMMRIALRALQVRAMWHLGEGRTAETWQDLLACHRLARLTSENFSLVGQLVAIAIDGVACNATTQILYHANLDAEVAEHILYELEKLGPASSCLRTLDQGERLTYLDTVKTLMLGGIAYSDLGSMWGLPTEMDVVFRAKNDWNLILCNGNLWHDKLVAAAKLQTRKQRKVEFNRIDDEISQRSAQINSPSAWIGSALNFKRRSEMVSDMLTSMLLSATPSAFKAEDRANAQLKLTRLAAVLAVYRAEQGEYPDQLADLVPSVVSKLPVDLYSGKSFLYERKNDGGYLLYSVFENEIDDGGDSMSGEIVDGQWVDQQPEGFDYAESDLVIRVPVPAFEFPEPPEMGE